MSLVLASKATLIGLCIAAAWLDLRSRRLPNVLALVTAIGGLGFAFALHPASTGLSHVWHGLGALVLGLVLFAVRWIGGGDAKFYAAAASWFPLKAALPLIGTIALTSVALFMVFFTVRRLQGKRIVMGSKDEAAMMPFGVAIGAAAAGLYALIG